MGVVVASDTQALSLVKGELYIGDGRKISVPKSSSDELEVLFNVDSDAVKAVVASADGALDVTSALPGVHLVKLGGPCEPSFAPCPDTNAVCSDRSASALGIAEYKSSASALDAGGFLVAAAASAAVVAIF